MKTESFSQSTRFSTTYFAGMSWDRHVMQLYVQYMNYDHRWLYKTETNSMNRLNAVLANECSNSS